MDRWRLAVMAGCLLLFMLEPAGGEGPWSRTYGRVLANSQKSAELAWSGQPTTDGGLIVGAYSQPGAFGATDFLIFKLDVHGDPLWQFVYGTKQTEYLRSVFQASDGSFLAAGSRVSKSWDVVLFRVAEGGSILWARAFGAPDREESPVGAAPLPDGSVIVCAYVFGKEGSQGIGVLRIDPAGNVIWARLIRIMITGQFGMSVAGDRISVSGVNSILFQMTVDGDLLWSRRLIGVYGDTLWRSVTSTPSGDVFVAGSRVTDVRRAMMGRYTADGSLRWIREYLSPGMTDGEVIRRTSDGGLLIGGDGAFVKGKARDVFLLKLNAAGKLLWQRIYGGQRADVPLDIASLQDQSLLITAYTQSFGSGGLDIWAFHADSHGNVPSCSELQERADFGLPSIFAATEDAHLAAEPFEFPSAAITLNAAPAELVVQRPCFQH